MAFGEFVSATDAMNDGTDCAHNNNDNEDSKMVKTGTMLFCLEASSKKVEREQKEVFFFVLWQREKTKDEDQFLSDKFVVK